MSPNILAWKKTHKKRLIDLNRVVLAESESSLYSMSEISYYGTEDNLVVRLPDYPDTDFVATEVAEDHLRREASVSVRMWSKLSSTAKATVLTDLVTQSPVERRFELSEKHSLLRGVLNQSIPVVSLEQMFAALPSKLVVFEDMDTKAAISKHFIRFFAVQGTFPLVADEIALYGSTLTVSNLGAGFSCYPSALTKHRELFVFRPDAESRTVRSADLSEDSLQRSLQMCMADSESMQRNRVYEAFGEGLGREVLPAAFYKALERYYGKAATKRLREEHKRTKTLRELSRRLQGGEGVDRLTMAVAYSHGVKNVLDAEKVLA